MTTARSWGDAFWEYVLDEAEETDERPRRRRWFRRGQTELNDSDEDGAWALMYSNMKQVFYGEATDPPEKRKMKRAISFRRSRRWKGNESREYPSKSKIRRSASLGNDDVFVEKKSSFRKKKTTDDMHIDRDDNSLITIRSFNKRGGKISRRRSTSGAIRDEIEVVLDSESTTQKSTKSKNMKKKKRQASHEAKNQDDEPSSCNRLKKTDAEVVIDNDNTTKWRKRARKKAKKSSKNKNFDEGKSAVNEGGSFNCGSIFCSEKPNDPDSSSEVLKDDKQKDPVPNGFFMNRKISLRAKKQDRKGTSEHESKDVPLNSSNISPQEESDTKEDKQVENESNFLNSSTFLTGDPEELAVQAQDPEAEQENANKPKGF